MLLDPQELRTVLNTDLLDREPSRLESNRLLLDMLMPLLDTKPSPSLPILMSPDLPRTLLTPLLFPLQSSLLPQHLMLPSPLHLSQPAPLPLTPLSAENPCSRQNSHQNHPSAHQHCPTDQCPEVQCCCPTCCPSPSSIQGSPRPRDR